jgi:hypothetical protein
VQRREGRGERKEEGGKEGRREMRKGAEVRLGGEGTGCNGVDRRGRTMFAILFAIETGLSSSNTGSSGISSSSSCVPVCGARPS